MGGNALVPAAVSINTETKNHGLKLIHHTFLQSHYIVKNTRDTLGVRFAEPKAGISAVLYVDAQHGNRLFRFELMGFPLGKCQKRLA